MRHKADLDFWRRFQVSGEDVKIGEINHDDRWRYTYFLKEKNTPINMFFFLGDFFFEE